MKKTVVLLLAILMSATVAGAQEIEIQAGVFGGTLYQISYAFTELLKTHEPGINASIVETPGSAAGIIKMEEKPSTRILAATYVPFLEATNGKPPFKKAYTDLRVLGNFTNNIQTLITFDPDIKTLDDLAGKRLGLGPKPAVVGKNHWLIIEKGTKEPGRIKISYMGWSSLKDALLDGSIDAMVLGVSTRHQGLWAPVPVFQEILASRGKPHFISLPEQAIKAASSADGITYPPLMMPKDAIAPGLPAADTLAWSEKLALFASTELSDDAAYTITKILYEHCDEMVARTPVARGVWPDLVADIHLSDDMIHPGALKYYKEKGLR